MSKHTPGPWAVTNSALNLFRVRVPKGHLSGDCLGELHTEANARLIAAAPDYDEMARSPEWAMIWQLLNAFAKGDTQRQYARAEPLAVLGEVYQMLAIVDVKRRAAIAKAGGA